MDMQGSMQEYLASVLKNRHGHNRRLYALMLLALFVVSGVAWQLRLVGVTLTEDTFCGYEEHIHDETCEGDPVLLCQECVEPHVHTPEAGCYETQSALNCELEVHAHGDACYTWALICAEAHEHVGTCYQANFDCEIEEHDHGESCYTVEQSLICPLEEGAVHEHTDPCWEAVYVCEMEEHVHEPDCYSDFSAVESETGWMASLPQTLTGYWGEDLLSVAESQLGYRESSRNFLTDGSGIRHGYTRYGDWWWDGWEYEDWNGMFLSFCMYYAGIPETRIPYAASYSEWAELLKKQDLSLRDGSYFPDCGDIAAILPAQSDAAVLSIVESWDDDVLTVIQGDVEGQVRRVKYDMTVTQLMGYLSLSDAGASQRPAEPTETTLSTETTAETTQTTDPGETTVPGETESQATEPGETTPAEATEPSGEATEPLPELTEAERMAVEDLIFIVDGMPTAEEIGAELARLEDLGDQEALSAYRDKMLGNVTWALTTYDGFTDAQRAAVTNAEKIEAYRPLLIPGNQDLVAPGKGYTLTLTCPGNALPQGTTVHTQAYSPDSEAYQTWLSQTADLLPDMAIVNAWIYDITLLNGEETVEPSAPVAVRLDLDQPLPAGEETAYIAIHFGTGGPEILPVEAVVEDGQIVSFLHTQSSFSPVAYAAVAPTKNPTDIGPDWLPVYYYVCIDDAWTMVGSTKTGWYGDYSTSQYTNTNRDRVTLEQVSSILGPYEFDANAANPAVQLIYQRRDDTNNRMHNDTQVYEDPVTGHKMVPIAKNALKTMGYNLYYVPTNTNNGYDKDASDFGVPAANSRFYSVSVLDANNLVYQNAEDLPQTQIVRNGKTVSVTVKAFEGGWQFTGSDGTAVATTMADNGDGTVTCTAAVTKKLVLSPKTNILEGASASQKPVHFMVWLDGKWTEVGSVDTSYYLEGYCKGSNDSAGNPRYRWFITTDQAYSVLAPFGFDPSAIVSDADEIVPSKNGEVKCMYFMHQTGPINTSGKDVYSSGRWSRMSDGKTWAIGMSYNSQEYTMYYVPGSTQYYQGDGNLNHTADIFAQTASNLDGSRFWSVTVRDDNQLVYSADVVQTLTQYVPEGSGATLSVSNGPDVMWTSNIKDLTPVEDENTTTFVFEAIRQPIVVSATEADPTFTVQYYGTIVQYVTANGTGEPLKVIDTSGRNLPKNGGTHSTINIYLKDSTVTAPSYSTDTYRKLVETKEVVTELYTEKSFNYAEYPGVGYVDKLKENESYSLKAVGVLKEGKPPTSDKMEDFDWYYSNAAGDNIGFTNILADATPETGEATADQENQILITSGTVLRFLYDSTSRDDDYVNRATFHDYDITDGTSGGEVQVGIRQINLREYYADPSRTVESDRAVNGLEGVYAFGNANCRTGLGRALWNGNELNKYNSLNSDVEGTTFGLVTGFDSNNNVIWANGINAPVDLFSTNPRPGKTTYTGGSLTFNRIGDTYTLTAANSTAGSRSDLEYFFTPKGDTSTRTNNFWVLDNATSKVDQLMGAKQYAAKGYNEFSNATAANNRLLGGGIQSGLQLPLSDDIRDHNWFFGMNFAISFTLTADYVGPLDYLFFGDDDLWVFLDGQLICDIGGVHISVGQYVDLRDYLPVGSEGQHTLTFFYTERGASGSTCWMSFTLPSVTSATTGRDIGGLEISKEVTDNFGNRINAELINEEYRFDVTLLTAENGSPLPGTYSYRSIDMNGNVTYGTIKNGGVLKLHPGDTLTITGLPAGAWYEIKEQEGSREGFSVTVNGGAGYIVKGSISSGTLSDADFVNQMRVELPSTGGGGSYVYTIGGWLLTGGGGLLMYSKKRKNRKGAK